MPSLAEGVRRVLFLDAYDSFSNNIVALAEETLAVEVTSVKIDDPRFPSDASFYEFLKLFDAVIAGPGPGSAENPQDVGLIDKLWRMPEDVTIPVLGICLGFQSLAVAFGGRIERLEVPHHGVTTQILHKGHSLFKGLFEVQAIQYHSLSANIGHSIQTCRTVKSPSELWQASEQCPSLKPIAWDFDERLNGAVLMGIKHVEKPFCGVQYHPESICTNDEGAKVILNWWEEAQAWNLEHGRYEGKDFVASLGVQDTPLTKEWTDYFGPNSDAYLPTGAARDFADMLASGTSSVPNSDICGKVGVATCGSGRLRVQDICHVLGVPNGEAIVLESGLSEDLKPHRAGTGRHSIIGLFVEGQTLRVYYYVKKRILQLRDGHDNPMFEMQVADVWSFLKEVMECLKPTSGPHGASWAPFWGGLMGFATYEACLDTINVKDISHPVDEKERPDLCFALITRSVVVDHSVKKIYVQSLRANDFEWIHSAMTRIREAVEDEKDTAWLPTDFPPELAPVQEKVNEHPDSTLARSWAAAKILEHYLSGSTMAQLVEDEYLQKIEECLDAIRAGESYELCLTGQTSIYLPSNIPSGLAFPWHLYQKLAKTNGAPFGAYVRMGKQGQGVTILSSSPERFVSWDRQGICQCRPIKGTVKKSEATREQAEEILNSSKERAENLMIVDLTRHQLYGVYGPGSVNIKQLMEIEEYETVYQLVSVIEAVPPGFSIPTTPGDWNWSGDTPSGTPTGSLLSAVNKSLNSSRSGSVASTPLSQQATPLLPTTPRKSGIDVLASSLPPGSMTGAPKKRSCELLQHIEGKHPRGIYSGILGYLDVGGGGDFNVVIRTAYNWDDDFHELPKVREPNAPASGDEITPVGTEKLSVWRIGAGGAITIQSDPHSEWEEMKTKLDAAFRSFVPVEVRDFPTKQNVYPKRVPITIDVGHVDSDEEDEERSDLGDGEWRAMVEEVLRAVEQEGGS